MPHWLFLTLLIAGGWISALVVFYALCERHFPLGSSGTLSARSTGRAGETPNSPAAAATD
jgi:hypothetical protein